MLLKYLLLAKFCKQKISNMRRFFVFGVFIANNMNKPQKRLLLGRLNQLLGE